MVRFDKRKIFLVLNRRFFLHFHKNEKNHECHIIECEEETTVKNMREEKIAHEILVFS